MLNRIDGPATGEIFLFFSSDSQLSPAQVERAEEHLAFLALPPPEFFTFPGGGVQTPPEFFTFPGGGSWGVLIRPPPQKQNAPALGYSAESQGGGAFSSSWVPLSAVIGVAAAPRGVCVDSLSGIARCVHLC